jgi:hypothetical protein
MVTGTKKKAEAMTVALPATRATRAQINDQQRFSLSAKTPTTDEKRSLPATQTDNQSNTVEPLAADSAVDTKHARSVSQSSNASEKYPDPLALKQHKRKDITKEKLKEDYPNANDRRLKKFYSRQNGLIDQFLRSGDEERLELRTWKPMARRSRLRSIHLLELTCACLQSSYMPPSQLGLYRCSRPQPMHS